MKYGYCRVSTDDQNVDLQIVALNKAGCKTVFKDEGISGGTEGPFAHRDYILLP